MGAPQFKQAQSQALERFGVAAESRFVNVPAMDGQAHVLVAGKGPPVVMVNGIGCPAAMWAPLMAELEGFTLYAIDPPGCGLTKGAPVSTATVHQQSVSFLEQCLDGLGLERPAFVANSMGSLWTMWLGLDRPRRVLGAIHVGTPALLLKTSAPLPMRLMSVRPLGRLLTSLQPPSVKRMDQTARMVHVDLSSEPEVREVMVESERMPGATPRFLALLNACLTLRGARSEVKLTAEQLQEIPHPVQLIWADDDPFGAVAEGQRAAEHIPDAELHVVPGGHVPWINAPDKVGQLARAFLVRLTKMREDEASKESARNRHTSDGPTSKKATSDSRRVVATPPAQR